MARLFELELLGGTAERRYRSMRPEVEAMPWSTLDPARYPQASVIAARAAWTAAAYQEHRTGAACAATLRALIEAQAPLDLVAMATRFPLDEMVHVELCARMAMALGGGTEINYEPDALILDADRSFPALVRATELVIRVFCVGEAISIPLLRGTMRAAKHPLPRAVLGRIVRDEAAHGAFGWLYLDWALPQITDPTERAHLDRVADDAIVAVQRLWAHLRARPRTERCEIDIWAAMDTDAYLAEAERSLARNVLAPLRARGVKVTKAPPPPA